MQHCPMSFIGFPEHLADFKARHNRRFLAILPRCFLKRAQEASEKIWKCSIATITWANWVIGAIGIRSGGVAQLDWNIFIASRKVWPAASFAKLIVSWHSRTSE